MRKFFILIAFVLFNLILFGSNSVRITITSANVLHYNSFLKQTNISLAANKTYLVSFWAKASDLLYLKSKVTNNETPISSEYTTKLSKEWRRYEYDITTPSNWNINTDKASIVFGTAYQVGTYDIDDVTITNYQIIADTGIPTDLAIIRHNDIKCIANNEHIEVFGDNFRKYEIINLSGQLIVSGFLQSGRAQFKTYIKNGLYIAKFTKSDETVVSYKLLVR